MITAPLPPALLDVPLDTITEFDNERGPIEPEDVADLAASIKVHGLLQPVLLRPDLTKEDTYQIVLGHRRVEACRIAGLTHVRAEVRAMPDWQLWEAQSIENDQRQDVAPMRQAIRYTKMLDSGHYGTGHDAVHEIAAKLGRPVAYVAGRLKLTGLIAPLQERLAEGQIPIAVAMLLARQPDTVQNAVRQRCNGIHRLADVSRFVASLTRPLANAPFPKLMAGYGGFKLPACSDCQFRTGQTMGLFGESEADDRCQKPTCFAKKLKQYLADQAAAAADLCPNVELVKSDNSASWNHTSIENIESDCGPLSDTMDADHAVPVLIVKSEDPSQIGRLRFAAVHPDTARADREAKRKAETEAAQLGRKRRDAAYQAMRAELHRVALAEGGSPADQTLWRLQTMVAIATFYLVDRFWNVRESLETEADAGLVFEEKTLAITRRLLSGPEQDLLAVFLEHMVPRNEFLFDYLVAQGADGQAIEARVQAALGESQVPGAKSKPAAKAKAQGAGKPKPAAKAKAKPAAKAKPSTKAKADPSSEPSE